MMKQWIAGALCTVAAFGAACEKLDHAPEKYLQDPEWGEKNPLVFEVSKENGVLIVRNSMESFMKPAQKMMKFADGTSFRKETGTASKDLVVDEEMAMI